VHQFLPLTFPLRRFRFSPFCALALTTQPHSVMLTDLDNEYRRIEMGWEEDIRTLRQTRGDLASVKPGVPGAGASHRASVAHKAKKVRLLSSVMRVTFCVWCKQMQTGKR